MQENKEKSMTTTPKSQNPLIPNNSQSNNPTIPITNNPYIPDASPIPKKLTQKDILNFIKQKKQELKEKFGVKRIGLFGSFARNENSLQSDIDFVVELEKKDFFIRSDLKNYLSKVFQRNVDLGYLDTFKNFIKKQVEKDIIYV